MHISGPLSRGWHTKFPSSWSWFNLSQAVRAIKLCFPAGGLEPCYRPLDLLWTCVGWCAALTGCRLTEATQAAGCWCEDGNRTEISPHRLFGCLRGTRKTCRAWSGKKKDMSRFGRLVGVFLHNWHCTCISKHSFMKHRCPLQWGSQTEVWSDCAKLKEGRN